MVPPGASRPPITSSSVVEADTVRPPTPERVLEAVCKALSPREKPVDVGRGLIRVTPREWVM